MPTKTTKRLLASAALLVSLMVPCLDGQASDEADFEVIMLGVGSPTIHSSFRSRNAHQSR